MTDSGDKWVKLVDFIMAVLLHRLSTVTPAKDLPTDCREAADSFNRWGLVT